MPNFNIYFDFTVPGVIPLTIIDAQSVHAEIMSLVIDPRLTTVLRIRQEGVATRATASLSSLAAEEPTVPAQTSPLTGSGPQPSASTQADQPEQALPPDPPTAEVFPGSDVPDWTCEQFGLDTRSQYRVVDRAVASVGRHFVPVEGNGICLFFAIQQFLAIPSEYTNQHMRREVVHHLATNMDLYVEDLIPLVRGIYGAGDPLTTPQSICSYLQELLRINFWADEIVLRVLSLIYNVTITVIRGDSGGEDRVRHSRDLSHVDIVLLLAKGAITLQLVSPNAINSS